MERDVETDVCIVGAGIAGLSAAYVLSRTHRVVVLERDMPGAGETGRTSAHLSNALDDRFFELERLFGEEGARAAAESHGEAVDWIERTALGEGIACDFERVPGYLFLGPEDDRSCLVREREAATRAGLSGVIYLERAPVVGFESGPCLEFPRQAQFHPLRYLVGLRHALERAGVSIHTGTRVTRVEGGSPALVETAEGPTVRCSAIIVATNTPFNDRVVLHTKQAPYRTYVIAGRVPKGSITRALFWSTEDPYHYVRVADAGDGREWLIVGGEDHKTGQADDGRERYDRLERWTRERLPAFSRVDHRWSGQVLEPVDSLAFIGPNPADRNVYVATGDSGNGLTHGTIAGILLGALIRGEAHRWAALYDPARRTLRAVREFAKENLNAAAQYADWVNPGDVDSVDCIEPGAGAVIRRGVSKMAVFRDENGSLHERSAVCPHLGGIVTWNGVERSWDCPCHGSRFDARGQVINGPANDDLAHVETPLDTVKVSLEQA